MTINFSLTLDQIIIWILVGLVAGALAGRVAMGHDLGLLGDIVAGIIGAFLGGILAQAFKFHVSILGSAILSQIVVAFIGAVILLFLLRIFGFGRGRK